jgi:hypothetical protein
MKRLLFISAFQLFSFSAFCSELPPSPTSVGPLLGTTGTILRSPKDSDQAVAMVRAAPLITHPLDTTNAPPIAVITILDTPIPPELKPYAIESGLNTPIPVSIRFGEANDVVLTYAVKLGKIYQVQFKMEIEKPWCCAYNDLIPAKDDIVTFHVPIYHTEPGRFFRVMSNE